MVNKDNGFKVTETETTIRLEIYSLGGKVKRITKFINQIKNSKKIIITNFITLSGY